MANKRKTTTAIVAGVTAVALLLGGTFAWTSISQQAKNETAGVVNVGGRLHDDFDGTNKDVYVENFTDPHNGGQPIYARVKLTEYMEVGKEAGQADNADRNAVPVVPGTDINNESTWTPHVPSESCAVCATEGTCKIHDHWEWTMGGDNETTGSTIFMPTFNKDKDSLAADINGTYHGTDETDKVYYDDYVVYTTDGTAEGVGVGIAEADKETYDGEIYSIVGTEYYDDDTDTEDNNGTRQVEGVTHIAKQTAEGSVMTMAEWEAAGSLPGNYWVYDTDGWAYWANPIMPGEATGLLLDGIKMTKNPGEKCYYAINVVAQFSTVNDWQEFYTDEDSKDYDVSPEAEAVLNAAAANVATVTVTNVSGETLLTPGESYEFKANVTVNGVQVLAVSDFEWSVLNADLSEAKSTITDGVLTVDANETSRNLIVVAKAINSDYLGALGMSSVAVDVPEVTEPVYAIEINSVGEEEPIPFPGYFEDGDTWQLNFAKDGVSIEGDIQWSVEFVLRGGGYTDSLKDGTKIGNDGVITIDAQESKYYHESYFMDVDTYEIISVSATDAEGNSAQKNFLICNQGFSLSSLAFYDTITGERVANDKLIANENYNVRCVITDDADNYDVTDYLDPVLPGDIEFTITKDGAETSDAKLENNQFTATATGTYSISGSDDTRGIEINDATVTVIPTLINQIANAQVVGSTAAGGENVNLPSDGGDYDMITISGDNYYVVAKDTTDGKERALLLGADLLNSFDDDEIFYVKFNEDGASNLWSESVPYNYLNTTAKTFTCNTCDGYFADVQGSKEYTVTSFLTKNPQVASLAMDTEINGTTSKVFLLSEADLYGTTGGVEAAVNDYTYIKDGAGIRLFEQSIVSESMYDHYKYNGTWLRSAYGDGTVAYLTSTGVIGNNPNGTENYYWGMIAPAFWVDISGADVYQ